MIASIKQRCEGRRVCILGFGMEGRSTYRLLRSALPGLRIVIADRREAIIQDPLLAGDPLIEFRTGPTYLEDLGTFDVVFKTPGIAHSALTACRPEALVSQTGLFIKAYRNQIIGITGTKGKSTTSSLVHHILQQAGVSSLLAGNIGIPLFDLAGQISPDTRIICELSSHQLEQVQASPHIAILLNLFEEHLDHYPDKSAYFGAKMNIAAFQQAEDHLVFHAGDPTLKSLLTASDAKGRRFGFALHPTEGSLCHYDEGYIFIQGKKAVATADCALQGQHNLLNMMAAACACHLAGLPDDAISRGLQCFSPLHHRLEFIGTIDGVDYYNDSIATIPEAAIAAVQAIDHAQTLILGGFDRGIRYDAFAAFLAGSKLQYLVFMGEAGQRIRSILEKEHPQHGKDLFDAPDLAAAVAFARKNTAPGKACLLSPAAASYDAFRNFAERGDTFRQLLFP